MNCGACSHWELKGSPMRAAGMGLCAKEQGLFARARTFSPTALCNKRQFEQATPAVIAAREKALQRQDAQREGGGSCLRPERTASASAESERDALIAKDKNTNPNAANAASVKESIATLTPGQTSTAPHGCRTKTTSAQLTAS